MYNYYVFVIFQFYLIMFYSKNDSKLDSTSFVAPHRSPTLPETISLGFLTADLLRHHRKASV